jgi:hypothetical protein
LSLQRGQYIIGVNATEEVLQSCNTADPSGLMADAKAGTVVCVKELVE